ncbi:hypothetical protein KAFR_0B02250 [Kazachstania africana CBS 2517]|uniref:Exonuclease domain-containing protein n=1 Tax=Kazachstania africana (strain ATCC 22294 / BCRC 22015 / CBS 2517 / CECT 1963 / NBRC 1671 / NRRL Y-8276) TaxID=1071382 RepID=H2AQ73_KAZAF|nr:hypothetical protein KAFR_0B02250 [Kazachstania africana CBS 2517]CCF56523.1 hypothetical protein KAFR_0B02250 [Kazachstania africana CBS 2517]
MFLKSVVKTKALRLPSARRLLPFVSQYYRRPSLSLWKMSQQNSLSPFEERNKIFKPIVWVDCEMTGLDHVNDRIIEICCIITDGNLNIIDETGYESVVHCDKSVLDNMNEWCIEHHGNSGLTAKVLASDKTKEQVETELLDYVKKYIPEKNTGILAGNSIHMDRLFMLKEFPTVIDHLFYRLIDVSTIMEVSRRHNPDLASVFPKKETAHTAKKDILESIEQLRWYMKHYLKNTEETKAFVEVAAVEKRRLEQEGLATLSDSTVKVNQNITIEVETEETTIDVVNVDIETKKKHKKKSSKRKESKSSDKSKKRKKEKEDDRSSSKSKKKYKKKSQSS